MEKCPDEKTLISYLDHRLPGEEWYKVRGHCYFCKNCQKIVGIAAEAISLRRNRLGLSQLEEQNSGLEALKLGLLISPPNDPKWQKAADELKKRIEES